MTEIKTWQERLPQDHVPTQMDRNKARDAEIAELRAALAASGGNAAPDGAVTDYGTLPELPEPLEINWPTLNSNALGCGVEDRGLHDRYECAEYGWEDGVDRAIERVPEAIYDADQMREYGKACHAMGRGAAVREYIENGTFKEASAPNAALVAASQQAYIYLEAVRLKTKSASEFGQLSAITDNLRAALSAAGQEVGHG